MTEMLTASEKYRKLFNKMMYNAAGHSNLVKRNGVNRHIIILCDEIQNEFGHKIQFWEDVKSLATINNKNK